MQKTEQQIRRNEGLIIMDKVMATFGDDHRLKELGQWWVARQQKLFLLEGRHNSSPQKSKSKST